MEIAIKYGFIFLFPLFTFSQSIIVESKLDTNIIGIGDVLHWTIETNIVEGKKIYFPDLEYVDNKISI